MIRNFLIIIFFFINTANCSADTKSKVMRKEGIIAPYKMEYFEFLNDKDTPVWLSGAVGSFSVSCGYRVIYGEAFIFGEKQVKRKRVVLHELLTEGCRESTDIGLRGEYLYVSSVVHGKDVVENAAIVIDRIGFESIDIEHESGVFLNNSNYYRLVKKQSCDASFYDGHAVCIGLKSIREKYELKP